jgi:hypothetical protein
MIVTPVSNSGMISPSLGPGFTSIPASMILPISLASGYPRSPQLIRPHDRFH